VTGDTAQRAQTIRLGRTTEVHPIDCALIARLVAAFNNSDEAACYGRGSQWQTIRSMHTAVASALVRRDLDAVGTALQRPDQSDIFYGFEDLGRWSLKAYEHPGQCDVYAAHCYGLLQRLAQAVGALREPNPEAIGRVYDVPPPSALATLVERALGFSIAPPAPYPNYRGLETDRGVLGERVLNALYCAYRVRQLTQGITRPRVLEIGAGLGRLAHYAYLAGITDYWIVDLPLTSLSHGHFLATALGGDRVVFDHESEGSAHDRIRIVNSERFFRESLPTFDLVVNVDSLTELGRPLAERYLNVIAARANLFLSVNHEANEFTVSGLETTARVFDRSQRHPYWLRRGYVEELFSQTGWR